jgi:cellulose synthase/poly-beta-1,6-N-acetylglucosamine synthase-like glycosyltransferase
MVSLHVPAHNEPPAMVIDTLRALLRLDYPRYEAIAIDDNTGDESLWRPVERWRASRVRFAHLSDWPGYKSGNDIRRRPGKPVTDRTGRRSRRQGRSRPQRPRHQPPARFPEDTTARISLWTRGRLYQAR